MNKSFLSVLAFIVLGLSLSAQSLFPILKKDKWGYMNRDGKIVIDFKYDLGQNFHEGYASVALRRLPCLIDSNDRRVIDTGKFQFIGTFSEGLVPVQDFSGKRQYLDKTGKTVLSLPPEIYEARSFYYGLARVGKKVDVVQNKFGFDVSNLGYKFAYIRKNGTYATEFLYDDLDDMEDGIGRYLIGMRFGLLDSAGKTITGPDFEFISSFNEGLAVINKSGRFGFINRKGEVVIPANYTYAKDFNEGLAAVEVEGKFGFINPFGKLVIQALYDDVRPFAEGRAAVLFQGKWAFIDPDGNYIYQPYFEEAGYFNEGICPVKLKGKWGAIDKEGKILVPFDFQNIGIFEDGIAEVIYKSINLYVNKKGEILPK